MGLWASAEGTAVWEMTGANLPLSLSGITEAGIVLYRLEFENELTVRFRIRRRDIRRLKAICKQQGNSLKLQRRDGIFWSVAALRTRPLLTAGIIALLLLTLFLPSRILFLEVEGCTVLSPKQILAAAEECGICFGVSSREIRSEKMKNRLLESLPQLKWAGINTYGCRGVISVREKPLSNEPSSLAGVSSIVAASDGIVTRCTAERGTLLCSPGQAVRKGEVLVSGYTDCGLSIRAENASGEVYAMTQREITVITPDHGWQRTEKSRERIKISLLLGKKRINLWKDSGISPGSCGRMYEEYYAELPGGCLLPAGIAIERFSCTALEETAVSPALAEAVLLEFSDHAIRQQMIAGTVTQSQTLSFGGKGVYGLRVTAACEEMIGRSRPERMELINGKAD